MVDNRKRDSLKDSIPKLTTLEPTRLYRELQHLEEYDRIHDKALGWDLANGVNLEDLFPVEPPLTGENAEEKAARKERNTTMNKQRAKFQAEIDRGFQQSILARTMPAVKTQMETAILELYNAELEEDEERETRPSIAMAYFSHPRIFLETIPKVCQKTWLRSDGDRQRVVEKVRNTRQGNTQSLESWHAHLITEYRALLWIGIDEISASTVKTLFHRNLNDKYLAMRAVALQGMTPDWTIDHIVHRLREQESFRRVDNGTDKTVKNVTKEPTNGNQKKSSPRGEKPKSGPKSNDKKRSSNMDRQDTKFQKS